MGNVQCAAMTIAKRLEQVQVDLLKILALDVFFETLLLTRYHCLINSRMIGEILF